MNKSEKIVFTILIIFLLLPNLLGTFLAVDLMTLGQRLLYLMTSLAMIAGGLCVLRRRTFFYTMMAGIVFWGVELVHLVVNSATTSMLFIFTIAKAEKGEFLELLSSYFPVLLIILALWGGYWYLVKHYIEDRHSTSRAFRLHVLSLVIAFFVASFIGLKLAPKFRNIFNFREHDMRTAAWVGVEKACPINIVLDCYHLLRLNHEINIEKRRLHSFSFGIEPLQDDANPILVLLLGETSRYDHWQLNGYGRETSPYLMARADQIVSFDSVYSVANLTTVSVPFILSRATPTNQDIYMHEKSVVDAFHEAGYRTAWIADQSFNNKFLGRIASGCDASYYITDAGKNATFVDTVLLPSLEHELAINAQRQMMVMHSLGCHFKYSSRYPDDFQYFMPDMKGIEVRNILRQLDVNEEAVIVQNESNIAVINNLRTILVNSYDNAIRFTDYFINEVIVRLEATNRPCVLVYVGDHGENLLDDERNMFLHGTYAGSLYEYHVPLFVWTSEQYRALYPEHMAAMQANRMHQFSTMNLFHSLLDLGGIETTLLDSTQSFAATKMAPNPTIYGLDANMQPFVITTQQ